MTAIAIQGVILSTLGLWGSAVFTILTAVIGIGLAYLVFRFGWNKVKSSLYGEDWSELMTKEEFYRKYPKTDIFIEHSASDLEFKRNYGRNN